MSVMVKSIDASETRIRSRFGERLRVSFVTDGDSLTEQYHKDDCDIHTILNRYLKTGVLPITEAVPQYGDFSDVQTYQEAQNLLIRTRNYFESLPSRVREMFDNDTATFLRYVNDPKNHEKLVELGVFESAEAEYKRLTEAKKASAAVSGDSSSKETEASLEGSGEAK